MKDPDDRYLRAQRGEVAVGETRKIAAILVADVVGYSRLAGADEGRTLSRLRALRSDLIDPTIAVHNGRVVTRTGDGKVHFTMLRGSATPRPLRSISCATSSASTITGRRRKPIPSSKQRGN
jgi:class 3 adenylate cyclase